MIKLADTFFKLFKFQAGEIQQLILIENAFNKLKALFNVFMVIFRTRITYSLISISSTGFIKFTRLMEPK